MRRRTSTRRALSGISQKMLTQTLRALEERRLIERTAFPVIPPRVEYRLTAIGESLNELLQGLCAWLEVHGADLEHSA